MRTRTSRRSGKRRPRSHQIAAHSPRDSGILAIRLTKTTAAPLLDIGRRPATGLAIMNATDQESSGTCYTHNAFISRAAARNRQILIDALTRTGFTNYPSEWWHWSFGDRYWAVIQNESHAIYGPVDESMLDEAAR
ncbi:hypothetical protein LGM46_10085 [Burkholderia arboris]|uniref:M15 family metallopeptidase n=1 Tax=Burkholderia arboris TaxID=488730 RepID=UPI001CF1E85D|nr:M15 family metallopeptidase [Burkholderia arboris]MCA8033337.1 hypothetical protein [Burkholderia arboris]